MTLLEVGRDEIETIVSQAVAALADGELVIIPTDTVYGLAARADVEESVLRIYAAKRRPADRPLPVLVARREQLFSYARDVPEAALRLSEAFWPGPLTIIVPRSQAIPVWVTAGENTVGLRQPDHPVALTILSAAPFPLAVTSANISGSDTPRCAGECAAMLAEPVAVAIEAGPLATKPSTVVKVQGDVVVVLRLGPITREQIQEAVGSECQVRMETRQ